MTHILSPITGFTYEHWRTHEVKIANYRDGAHIFFMGETTAYDADDWQKCYPSKNELEKAQ